MEGTPETTPVNSESAVENSETDVQDTTNVQDTEVDTQENNPDETNEGNEPENDESENDSGAEDDGASSTESDGADEVFVSFDDGEVINRADAEKYAKVGYQFEKHTLPTIRKFEMIMTNSKRADGSNYESLEEFADELVSAIDDELLTKCRNDANDNEELAQELYKSRKAQRDSSFEQFQTQKAEKEQSIQEQKTQAVAQQFEELQKSFPEYKAYADLPAEVKTLAAKTGISLLDAKLRVDFKNNKAIEKAKADAEKAKNASTGSQIGQGEHEDPTIDAMIKEFRK